MDDDETIARLTVERDAARAALGECAVIVEERWKQDEATVIITNAIRAWRAERLAEWRRAMTGELLRNPEALVTP